MENLWFIAKTDWYETTIKFIGTEEQCDEYLKITEEHGVPCVDLWYKKYKFEVGTKVDGIGDV